MQKVLIIDTSMLCVWLGVPGKETCGNNQDKWNQIRVQEKIEQEKKQSTTFVLPLATIIETGNHIAQSPSLRSELARKLSDLMRLAADEQTPWTAFTNQSVLWEAEGLKQLAQEWAPLAAQKLSIGDVSIKAVADFYGRVGYQVEIFTGDAGLKAYEPATPTPSSETRNRRNRRKNFS